MTQVYYCNRYTSLRIREVMTSRLCTNQKSQGEISTLTTHIDVDHIIVVSYILQSHSNIRVFWDLVIMK